MYFKLLINKKKYINYFVNLCIFNYCFIYQRLIKIVNYLMYLINLCDART